MKNPRSSLLLGLLGLLMAAFGLGLLTSTVPASAGNGHDAAKAAKQHRHVISKHTRKAHGALFVTPFANGRVAVVTPDATGTQTTTLYSDGSGVGTEQFTFPANTADALAGLAAANGGAGAVPSDQQIEDYLHAGVTADGPPADQVSNPALVGVARSKIIRVTPRVIAKYAGRATAVAAALPSGSLCTGWANYSSNDIHMNTCSTYTGISGSAYHTHGVGTGYSNDGQHGDSCLKCDHLTGFGDWSWMSTGQVTDWAPSSTINNGSCRTFTMTVGYQGTGYSGSHTECPDTIGPWNLFTKEDGAKWSTATPVNVTSNGNINYRDSGFETVTSSVQSGTGFQVGDTIWWKSGNQFCDSTYFCG